MDKYRLRHLAGMDVDERPVEMLKEAGGRIYTLRNVAYQLYQIAEENIFNEMETGKEAVTGDMIANEYERMKALMDQYVEELIKEEHN